MISKFYLEKDGKYWCDNGTYNADALMAKAFPSMEQIEQWKEKFQFIPHNVTEIKFEVIQTTLFEDEREDKRNKMG